MTGAQIALYSRTYWDVTVDVDLATLDAGKGKLDVPSAIGVGGFACNAARAIGGRWPAGAVQVVTVAPALDVPRLRAALPAGVGLEVIAAGDDAWLPITIVLNPARHCRILRDASDRSDRHWQLAAVPAAVAGAALHVVGRLPAGFVADLAAAAHAQGARIGWCGGAALPLALERACDLLCVNTAEAVALLGGAARSTRDCAQLLAERATGTDVVRVVTGAGAAATVAVHRRAGGLEVHESTPVPIAPARISTLLGVGDAFAAHFMVAACFDDAGRPRGELAVGAALAAAQAAATRFLTRAEVDDG